jgi:uncharacterized protein (TIGR02996 family)
MQYWRGQGRFQDQYRRLEAVVPSSGPSPTLAGELTRCLSRLVRERYNNGNANRDDVYVRGLAGFLRVFRDDMANHVEARWPHLFGFTALEFREACIPVYQMRGGANSHNEATDRVCDVVLFYAAVLSGEPPGEPEPDERGFLAAVAADPSEVAPRLAYADWLGERFESSRELAVRTHAHVAGLLAAR